MVKMQKKIGVGGQIRSGMGEGGRGCGLVEGRGRGWLVAMLG